VSVVAHIMEEVEPGLYADSANHLKIVRAVLSRASYRPRSHGVEHCPPDVVEYYRTQTNMRYPYRAAFTDSFTNRVRRLPGDIVVATEPWHRECFKGLLRNGAWDGMHVIELLRQEGEDAPIATARMTLALSELNRCPNRFASKIRRVLETTLS